MIDKYDSWPAVSQISKLAASPPANLTARLSNSTPIVMSWASPKCRSVNMSMRLDLPTSVSPMMMYLKRCGSFVVVAAIAGCPSGFGLYPILWTYATAGA